MHTKKPSLSVFFPCYNDAGTIATMVVLAFKILAEISDDFEVIVIDDGSSDASREVLEALKLKYDGRFKVVMHKKNEGYDAALRTGFVNATKEFVFYTDGDAQYDVRELKKLVALIGGGADIINGFKINRKDPYYRILIGKIYHNIMKIIFNLKIKDVDCDFRLMRKRVFEKITLEYNSGVICLEMVKKLQDAGFKFKEVGVSHYFRAYGKSQLFNFKRIFKVGVDILNLWWKLIILKRFRRE